MLAKLTDLLVLVFFYGGHDWRRRLVCLRECAWSWLEPGFWCKGFPYVDKWIPIVEEAILELSGDIVCFP